MEYLEFQGGLDCVDDDGEGITLRLVPEINDAIGKDSPVYRIYIDQPEDAEKIGRALVEYSQHYEIESIGIEGGTKLEIYFFDIEAPIVILGSSVEVLRTSLEAEDYEAHIQNMLQLINEYSEETVELREKLNSAGTLINEVERRWEIKLEGHDLSAKEERLHKEFVKTLNRVRHRLGT